jgi:hypothetical protein
MRSVYVIGGAGAGKSTFTRQLLDSLGETLGPQIDLHAKPNKKNVVTVRGHEVGDHGIYLGCMRESFPGTDGLDRATSPAGAEWLRQGASGYHFLVAEGATLATRPFLTALHETSDLLLVHLWAEDWVKELRFRTRGSDQADQFVKATETRAENLLSDMRKLGVQTLSVDSVDMAEWVAALMRSVEHLDA